MITRNYARTMARYNSWQNTSLYTAADSLSDAERRLDRGAFFKSIHATLAHLLWGDTLWLSRFPHGVSEERAARAVPESWQELRQTRTELDAVIERWAEQVSDAWLANDLSWHSGLLKKQLSMPVTKVVTHFFNHQTHHRGQVHAMLTAAGAKPDDTDLMLMD